MIYKMSNQIQETLPADTLKLNIRVQIIKEDIIVSNFCQIIVNFNISNIITSTDCIYQHNPTNSLFECIRNKYHTRPLVILLMRIYNHKAEASRAEFQRFFSVDNTSDHSIKLNFSLLHIIFSKIFKLLRFYVQLKNSPCPRFFYQPPTCNK